MLRSGLAAATTSRPRARSRSTTPFQLADSANAPWTRTIVGFWSDMGSLLCSTRSIRPGRPSSLLWGSPVVPRDAPWGPGRGPEGATGVVPRKRSAARLRDALVTAYEGADDVDVPAQLRPGADRIR